MEERVAGLRRSYERGALRRSDLAPTWTEQLRRWLDEALADPQIAEASAMVLATATADAVPSARTVLLKGLGPDGLRFFTNLGSRKANELAQNPRASLVFPWIGLERQVLVAGRVSPLPREQVAAYAHSRPRGSQLSAWVSAQSEVIEDRAVLERRRDELARRWPEPAEVPVPPFWGGFLVTPVTVEFWQGRPDRLHDRLRFRRLDEPAGAGGQWVVERLAP